MRGWGAGDRVVTLNVFKKGASELELPEDQRWSQIRQNGTLVLRQVL